MTFGRYTLQKQTDQMGDFFLSREQIGTFVRHGSTLFLILQQASTVFQSYIKVERDVYERRRGAARTHLSQLWGGVRQRLTVIFT